MSKVQKSVLEHTTTEARKEEELTGAVVGVNSAKVVQQDMLEIPFIYQVPREHWENPDSIRGAGVTLPSGKYAWFLRTTEWANR